MCVLDMFRTLSCVKVSGISDNSESAAINSFRLVSALSVPHSESALGNVLILVFLQVKYSKFFKVSEILIIEVLLIFNDVRASNSGGISVICSISREIFNSISLVADLTHCCFNNNLV